MTSLAMKSRHGPVRVQNRPRQLNTQTLNSVKVKAEQNMDFERADRHNTSAAGEGFGTREQSTHHKLVNNDSQLTIEDIEIRTCKSLEFYTSSSVSYCCNAFLNNS